MKKRAVISVSDKEGIVSLGNDLTGLGYEIVSTGGTAKLLAENGIPVTKVEDVTGFPECLDGRVKTLHPRLFAGILADTKNAEHMEKIEELSIDPVGIVVSNLYPFAETVAKQDCPLSEAIEQIDVGGPSMIRAAAKNYKSVIIVTDPSQYGELIERLSGDTADEAYRLGLSARAIGHTAAYDAHIAGYLNGAVNDEYPKKLTLAFEKKSGLRYGENPDQSAAFYVSAGGFAGGVESAVFLQGKELSFNNIADAQAAIELVGEFGETACAAIKHSSPCGAATGKSVLEAYEAARACDPQSIFGGIVAFNRPLDGPTAEKMTGEFLEVVIAPSFSDCALRHFKKKKSVRLLELADIGAKHSLRHAFKGVGGGMLIQGPDANDIGAEEWTVATKAAPTEEEKRDLVFAMKVARHVKSNAIVVARDGRTLGIGGGQVSRVWAAESAIGHALFPLTGAVLASDALLPFDDVVKLCANAGIKAIIQPGGSIKDSVSIKTCDENGIAMVFTGKRHFKH
ncbi:MAG: bifunctional phosphoribosylaminoimidazolecarboxamide formyltransferase/IMP cyclohydrolase [Defluviitaleaceae bacterium]|nr:bifunctional phosphoribosylaminoimidazolecarboxamide formyltransferase/IMP cyclohydrolase [Defluviitaleaceae bacterium]